MPDGGLRTRGQHGSLRQAGTVYGKRGKNDLSLGAKNHEASRREAEGWIIVAAKQASRNLRVGNSDRLAVSDHSDEIKIRVPASIRCESIDFQAEALGFFQTIERTCARKALNGLVVLTDNRSKTDIGPGDERRQ